MMRHNTLYIYCDGSYMPKDQCGGWAALLWFNKNERLLKDSAVASSSHEMEVMAAVMGLRAVNQKYKGQIVVVSDAKSLMDRMNNKCGYVQFTTPLMPELVAFREKFSITWQWVKGHDKHPQNEYVDRAARWEAYKLINSKQVVP